MRDLVFGRPVPKLTLQKTTGTTTGSTALPIVGGGQRYRLYSPVDTFIAFGISTVTAVATTDMRLVGGIPEEFVLQDGDTHIAYILASGASTLDITPMR